MQVPNSCWSQRIALHVSVSSNSTSCVDDSLLLVGLISLVVSVEGNSLHLVLSGSVGAGHFLSSCQGRSRITDIGTENFVTDDENTYASWTREPKVDARILVQPLCDPEEWLVKLLLDLSGINNSLINFSLIESVLNGLFDLLRENRLDVLTDKLTVDTMTISNGEEVGPSILTEMWQHQEWILVDLVRILWRITSLCSKCEFRDTVVELFARLSWLHGLRILRSWNFLGNWGSNIVTLYIWFTTIRSLLGQSLLVIFLRKVLLLTAISLFGMRVSQMKIGKWFSRSLPLSISIVLHELSFRWLPTGVDSNGIVLLKRRILFRWIFIILSRGRWLSPAIVPLIILTNVRCVCSIWSLMASKRPQVGLLVELGHHLFLIRILSVNLVLNICGVDGIKLFLLIEQLLLLGVGRIVTIQVLLILLLTLKISSFYGIVFMWWSLVALVMYIITHLSNLALLSSRIDDLREVTLSPNLLSIVDLLWRLVLLLHGLSISGILW